MATYKLNKYGGVIRMPDGAMIPECPDNVDWRDYQEWLAAGNKPEPAEPPEEIAERQAREAKQAQLEQIIRDNLPSYAQVVSDVGKATSLAELRGIVQKLAEALYVHVKGDTV